MRNFALSILYLFLSTSVYAFDDPKELCAHDSISYDPQIQRVVNYLCNVNGLKNRFIIKSCSEVNYTSAYYYEGKPYVLFNNIHLFPLKQLNFSDENKLPKITDQMQWNLLGELSHELAHHFLYHFQNPPDSLSQMQMELEADEYMGLTLARIGATLEQTLAVLNNVPEHSVYTYPSRQQRQDAAKKGYELSKQLKY